ncbi:hypothetical protein DSO57_1012971, partial [Entomophthora muscae]
MTVYPIVTALTGFQFANLVPYFARILPQLLGLYTLKETYILSFVPSCAPWLVTGFVLMGLNSYFPQLSQVSSLWSPLRAAVPVIHWVTSWWFFLPGWEPNLVILAPIYHILGHQG